ERFISTEARILRFPHLLSSVYFEVFAKLLSCKSVQLQQLTACLAAFVAARWRIIRGLKSESTP
ncbi:MAG: hypothetical protein ACOKSU_22165, partial [Pseudomonas sp.]